MRGGPRRLRAVGPPTAALICVAVLLGAASVRAQDTLTCGVPVTRTLQPAHELTGAGEQSRAVAPSAVKLRVTAVEASVRSRPSMQSEVVGTVRRGALVEVAGEERDWYQIRVDGRPGWVEREAFE